MDEIDKIKSLRSLFSHLSDEKLKEMLKLLKESSFHDGDVIFDEGSHGDSLYLVAQVAMMGFVVLFLHDEHGYSTGEAAAVFAVGQGLAAVLRIAVGRWSDVLGSRVRPLRRIGIAIAAALAAVAVLSDAPGLLLVPALAVATALSMAWNGLSFTIAA